MPQLGRKENDIFSIWRLVSLPIVREIGLQNILTACEIERDNWSQYDIETTILGLNKLNEIYNKPATEGEAVK